MTDSEVSVEGGTLEKVDEGAAVEVGLSEVEVQFCAGVLGSREELGEDFGFQTVGDGVVELDFGIEGVQSRPCLSQGKTCISEHGEESCSVTASRRSITLFKVIFLRIKGEKV